MRAPAIISYLGRPPALLPMCCPGCYSATMKLTKSTLGSLKLPPNKKDHTFYDSDLRGLGVRLRAGGKRTWVAVYRIGQKSRRVSIGDASAVTPEEARNRAREILAKADLGEDSQAQKAEDRKKRTLVFQDIVDAYMDRHVVARLRPRSQEEVRRHLRSHWAIFHKLPLSEIDRIAVAARLSELATESGPVAANRSRASLNALFTWAMHQGLAEINPVADIGKPGLERSRDRILKPHELAAVWNACGEDDYGRIVRLLILTGQRRQEVAGMTWQELDIDRSVWSLPSERTKNALPHDVPLSSVALSIVSSIEPRASNPLLFGRGVQAFSGWSRCKRRLDERSGVERWRIHDLRRTAVTGMAEIGIQPHVIEAVVNHISGHKGGIAGIYNRASYAEEKRDALARWADHIETLLNQEAGGRAADS